MSLRDYQVEDLNAVAACDQRGERRLLGVWPTGGGKTLAIANLKKFVKRDKRTLVVVNREELVWQTKSKFEKYNPALKVGVEKAGYRSGVSDDIVIASVQTIGGVKQNEDGTPDFGKRIQLLDYNEFDTTIVDESHHVLSRSWQQCLQYMRVHKGYPDYNDESKLLVCLTATPNRGDNKGLEEVCSTIAFSRDLIWAIQNKWLCDISAWRVNTHVDISDVKITAGDLDQKQLANKINNPARNELVVRKFIEITEGGQKKALFFTLDIAHAEALAEELNKTGVKAIAVSSRMSDEERALAFKLHQAGKVTALTGAAIFLEGYDDPSIEVVCMVRPTKSGLLYRQAIGRGLRPFPSPEDLASMYARGESPQWIKEYCIVIDFVDVSSRHSLITVPTLFGMSSAVDLKGKKAGAALDEIQAQLKSLPAAKQALINLEQFEDLGKLQGVIEKIDLLGIPSTPPEVQRISELSWVGSESNYMLALPDYTTYSIKPNALGSFDTFKITKGFSELIGNSEANLQAAIKAVENKIPDDQFQFAKISAKWKKEPVTQSQLNLLKTVDKNGVYRAGSVKNYMDFISKNLSKGDASALISQLISGKK